MIKLIDKLMICLGAMTVGLIIDIFSLLFNYIDLFSLGTLIIAVTLMIIATILYWELRKYEELA